MSLDNLMPAKLDLGTAQITNALAMELAAQLTGLPDILERYSLSKAQLKRILKDPEFRIIYGQAKARWGADANATERVISKSTIMVEDSLIEIYGILHDVDSSPNNKIQAFNALVELSDAAPRKQAAKPPETGEKFSITINLSGGKRQFDIDNSRVLDGELINGS